MAEEKPEFAGSIPENYDRYLGPLFFEGYAADLARRVAVPVDGRVLEVACGTGISAAALREALPESVEIVSTDLSESMLEFAKAKLRHLVNAHFEPADAQALPFEDGSFDAVACQFGMMFLPDKLAGMREAARVLKPGGHLVFNVWDSMQLNPIVRVLHEKISGFFGGEPPSFMNTPFGYYELDPIKTTLAEAGFARIDFSVLPTMVEHPSAKDAARGLVQGNPLVNEIREHASASPEEITEAVAEALRGEFGDAPMRAPMQAIVVTAHLP